MSLITAIVCPRCGRIVPWGGWREMQEPTAHAYYSCQCGIEWRCRGGLGYWTVEIPARGTNDPGEVAQWNEAWIDRQDKRALERLLELGPVAQIVAQSSIGGLLQRELPS